MPKPVEIDIKCNEIVVLVDGKKVLHIGQVSDDETINLFLEPLSGGMIEESVMHQENKNSECTHELLCNR